MRLLRVRTAAEVLRGSGAAKADPVDAATLDAARSIVDDVRARGAAAVREHAERLGDLEAGASLLVGPEELSAARAATDAGTLRLLEAAAGRVRSFAEAQRGALRDLDTSLPGEPGVRLGHELLPVERAGCYAPGGRYPLPSSVLMTAVTARAAGCDRVIVASPVGPDGERSRLMLAAAAVAGADAVLRVGGAQAIAGLAFGLGDGSALDAGCDAVVGPGNRFVTAAKQLIAGRVAIDMLAGPSEVLVIADGSADAGAVAADLIAQAEHDTDAGAILVTTSAGLVGAVEAELAAQLAGLPTAETARAALERNGIAVVAADLDEAAAVADRFAPEHLEIMAEDAGRVASRLRHAGALFIGAGAAEAIGDYGVGPNHTLPTSGTARSAGGLSVMTFLRMRTFVAIEPGATPGSLARETAALARLEGLEGHARSAERRP